VEGQACCTIRDKIAHKILVRKFKFKIYDKNKAYHGE
jgi:hypothetical protein